MEKRHFLGFDFGASSGRAMLGSFDGERIEIEEIHRFSNDPVMLCGRFVWDLPRLVFEMKQALLKLSKTGVKVSGIGIDTWGVDFGLLDKNGRLLGLPVHYRDARTDGVMDEVFKIIPKKELFERTGTAFNQFNTLYQLYAMKLEGDPALEMAEKMLFMPDLLAYFLTGEKGVEYTMVSTSQLLDPRTRNWSREVFERLGLPEKLAAKIQMPGAKRGTLLPEIARECGVPTVNLHLNRGVYFSLPDRKIFLYDIYRERYLDRVQEMRDRCAEAAGKEVRVLVENTNGFLPFQRAAIDLLLKSDTFGLTWDIGHSQTAAIDDTSFLLEHLNRVEHFHIHDVYSGKCHLALGTGIMDIQRYLALAEKRNARCVIEIKTAEALAQSVEWLRSRV